MQRISPFLWFDNQAEEAASYYVSIFKNSKIRALQAMLKMTKIDIAALHAAYDGTEGAPVQTQGIRVFRPPPEGVQP